MKSQTQASIYIAPRDKVHCYFGDYGLIMDLKRHKLTEADAVRRAKVWAYEKGATHARIQRRAAVVAVIRLGNSL